MFVAEVAIFIFPPTLAHGLLLLLPMDLPIAAPISLSDRRSLLVGT
jgi:hypothetical protein